MKQTRVYSFLAELRAELATRMKAIVPPPVLSPAPWRPSKEHLPFLEAIAHDNDCGVQSVVSAFRNCGSWARDIEIKVEADDRAASRGYIAAEVSVRSRPRNGSFAHRIRFPVEVLLDAKARGAFIQSVKERRESAEQAGAAASYAQFQALSKRWANPRTPADRAVAENAKKAGASK